MQLVKTGSQLKHQTSVNIARIISRVITVVTSFKQKLWQRCMFDKLNMRNCYNNKQSDAEKFFKTMGSIKKNYESPDQWWKDQRNCELICGTQRWNYSVA